MPKKPDTRKAKVRGPFIEHVRRDKLLKLYNGCCGICGDKVNKNTFTIDHVIPVSKGGHHAYDNCQPAHPWCNIAKADHLPSQAYKFMHLIGKRKKLKYKNGKRLGTPKWQT